MLHCSRLLLLCNRIPVISCNCKIFTYEALLARSKKLCLRHNRIAERFSQSKDQNKLEQELEEEYETYDEDGEQDFDTFDFSKAHLAYDEYHREKRRMQDRIDKKIIVNKFFAPAKEPPMLTCNERECIKYLNKEDPVQWNVQALSESFPATPDIIRKVLRSHWKPTPKNKEQMDIKVQENWELLNAGKLKATPAYIEHLKNFTNRRHILLEQIKNSNFYLPEIKKEKVWNNGQMNSILNHYEKQIKNLHKKNSEQLLIENGSEVKESAVKNSGSDKNIVHYEQFNKEQDKFSFNRKESTTVGQMLSKLNEPITMDTLKSNVTQKAEAKSRLSQVENKIFDNSFGRKNDFSNLRNHKNEDDPQNLNYFQEKKYGYKQYEQKLPRQLIAGKSSVSVRDETTNEYYLPNEEEIISEMLKRNKFQHSKRYNNNPAEFEEENYKVPPIDNTYTERNVNELFENETETDTDSVSKRITSMMKYREFLDESPERLEKDRLVFEKKEEDLKKTAFWNCGTTCQDKIKIEAEKKESLIQLKDRDKVTLADVSSTDSFPMRIKLPKNSQGSGLIFKIRDCYYDDDGKFLYRVPGMTK